MTKITGQASEVIALQETFNQRVNSDWVKAGYKWNLAALMESAELMERLPWKWWKAGGEIDLEQSQMEVVDIFHFVLSAMIVSGNGSANYTQMRVEALLRGIEKATLEVTPETPFDPKAAVEAVQAFMVGAAGSVQYFASYSLHAFSDLCAAFRMDVNALINGYISKNALNTVRNLRGYKSGGYIKTWEDKEDNQHLSDLMRTMPGAGFDEIVAAMLAIYDTQAAKVGAPA